MPEPWERLHDETGKAYAAFQVFLSLGAGRSIARAWAEHRRRNDGETAVPTKTPRHWEGWSAAHQWAARAEAWDAFKASQARQVQLKEWTELAEALGRQERERLRVTRGLCQAALRLAATGLADLLKRQQEESVMTVSDLSRLLRSVALVSEQTFEADKQMLSLDSLLIWYAEQQGA